MCVEDNDERGNGGRQDNDKARKGWKLDDEDDDDDGDEGE